MHLATLITTLAGLYTVGVFSNTLERRSPNKLMIFDCSKPKLNGVNCQGLPESLTWDQPGEPKQMKRARKAGCGENNRCSEKNFGKPGWNCDEYPFRSVKQSDDVDQVNRCVLQGHNS
ncbi:hypothetical protein PHISCL_09208, partial [Aspergillus sclerotialis]